MVQGAVVAEETLGFGDYVKAAFSHRVPLPLLGPMPLNAMALFAFAVLGVVNPGFWFLGGALELGYLGFLSGSSRFQKLVQGERIMQRQRGWDDRVQHTVASLSGDSRERYRRLLSQCSLILGIAPAQDGTLRDIRAGGLNQLLWLFLRLLSSRELITSNLSQVDPKALADDVEQLKARLAKAEADSALARSLQATLDIQNKRLENLTRAKSSAEVIDAELERIEQQVRLIREETAVSGGPEILSSRLDAVSSTIGETSRWMDQHAEFFGSLVSDDLDAGAPLLPPPPLPETAAQPAAPAPPRPPARAKQKG